MHSDNQRNLSIRDKYQYSAGVNMRPVSPAGGGIKGGGISLAENELLNSAHSSQKAFFGEWTCKSEINNLLILRVMLNLPLPPLEGDMHSDL